MEHYDAIDLLQSEYDASTLPESDVDAVKAMAVFIKHLEHVYEIIKLQTKAANPDEQFVVFTEDIKFESFDIFNGLYYVARALEDYDGDFDVSHEGKIEWRHFKMSELEILEEGRIQREEVFRLKQEHEKRMKEEATRRAAKELEERERKEYLRLQKKFGVGK